MTPERLAKIDALPTCECPSSAHYYGIMGELVYCTNCGSHCFAKNSHPDNDEATRPFTKGDA